MSVLSGLFNVLALLYVFRGLSLAVGTARNWSTLTAEPMTRAKQAHAEQAAFFFVVPVSVLIHELAHALAIWAFGGRVVEFAYRVFWGFVVPDRRFSPSQEWIIAIVGTVGSLLTGLFFWWLLRRSRSRTLRYFGLRAFRFQVFFSLIYYPLFSLVLPIGDWRTIYDFAATPLLSAGMAAAHAFLLGWFWRADRAGEFEMAAFPSAAAQTRHGALEAAAARGDAEATTELVDGLIRGNAPRSAMRQLDVVLQAHPNAAAAHLQKALLLWQGKSVIPQRAVPHLEAALRYAESPVDAAQAHGLLAMRDLQRGDGVGAEARVNAALALIPQDTATQHPLLAAELHHTRAQALRRQGYLTEAAGDASLALSYAHASGETGRAAIYQDELETISKAAQRRGSEIPSL